MIARLKLNILKVNKNPGTAGARIRLMPSSTDLPTSPSLSSFSYPKLFNPSYSVLHPGPCRVQGPFGVGDDDF